jgi:hypothetical protein
MNTRSRSGEEGALEDEEDAEKMLKNRRSKDARVRVRDSRLTYATGAQCRRRGQGASIQAEKRVRRDKHR